MKTSCFTSSFKIIEISEQDEVKVFEEAPEISWLKVTLQKEGYGRWKKKIRPKNKKKHLLIITCESHHGYKEEKNQ